MGFSLSNRDKSQVVHGIVRKDAEDQRTASPESRQDNVTILRNLPRIVANAFPAESYRDIKSTQGVKGEDPKLKGIHRFYAPASVDGRD